MFKWNALNELHLLLWVPILFSLHIEKKLNSSMCAFVLVGSAQVLMDNFISAGRKFPEES